MGFLSKYSETVKIDLGDGFNVEVRKYLSASQRAAAEKKLISAHMVMGQDKNQGANLVSDVDAAEFRLELCAQAVVSWNLTDENEQLLQLSPIESLRVSIGRLPSYVIDEISKVVDAPVEEAKKSEDSAPLVIDVGAQEQPAWPS